MLLGVLAASGASRLVAGMLSGVDAHDVGAFAIGPGLLLVVALAASYLARNSEGLASLGA